MVATSTISMITLLELNLFIQRFSQGAVLSFTECQRTW